VCDFFASRAVVVPAAEDSEAAAAGKLTLLRVVGPDEKAGVRDSNAYTNGLVRGTLDFCGEAAALLRVSPANLSRWRDTSRRMYVPVNGSLWDGGPVHPQYSGYDGRDINQADAALLQYPLRMPMDAQVARNDLLYYAPRSSGPATAGYYTGDSAYSIAWLLLGNRSAADRQFQLAFEHMEPHFFVWAEVSRGGQLGGHLNFITGAGGYVQNVLYGYAGLQYLRGGMALTPLLPPNGVTRLVLRALSFAGRRVTIGYNETTAECMLLAGAPLTLRSDSATHQLAPSRPVAVPRRDGARLLIFA